MVGDARFELATELDNTQTNAWYATSTTRDITKDMKEKWSVMQDSNLRLNLITPRPMLGMPHQQHEISQKT